MKLKVAIITAIAIIFLISTYLKLAPILNNNFPFTMDQARDMLDIREIAVGFHPVLIGPTTSINGVFLGPFYYYFNLIPFIISGGDPAFLVYWSQCLMLLPLLKNFRNILICMFYLPPPGEIRRRGVINCFGFKNTFL